MTIQGRDVPLRLSESCEPPAGEDWLGALLRFPPFEAWVASLRGEAEFVVTSVELQHLDMFDEPPSALAASSRRPGRAKIEAHVCNDSGVTARTSFVLRGPSAVLLLLFACDGVDNAVVCQQPRVAAAADVVELPGGFVGADGSFAGRCADGLRRAVPALGFDRASIMDITRLVYEERASVRGVATVPMGSDEQVTVLLYRAAVDAERLAVIAAALRGAAGCAPLRFDVVALDDLPARSTDARALAACYLYAKLRDVGDGPDALDAAELP